eukprot:CAMPEP_0197022630 /NCGR_PEP_ID=MMETSP1384-20130603/3453_1 /TAXON_ID=29189 /ORGANISM="Ammonia sp." /LENGTH=226 /DNA_ID=CAMNT_0042450701 /DNA_START=50 /DNA_END=730 /DNA_ORIENTATION=+
MLATKKCSPLSMEYNKQELLFSGIGRESHIILPTDIVKLMCCWAQWIDAWDTRKSNSFIKIKDDVINPHGDKIHCIQMNDQFSDTPDTFYHAFGLETISRGMTFAWNIKIMQYNQFPAIIGIVDDYYVHPNLPDFTNETCFGYGFALHRNTLCLKDRHLASMHFEGCSAGTVITLRLDMTGKDGESLAILTFSALNKTYLCKGIDPGRKYRLCVAFNHKCDQFAII